MSNWICKECGANYIDVSHQEPSVLKQELEIRQLKELLKECKANLIHKKQLLEKLDKLEKPTKKLLAKIDNAIREKRNE